MAGLGCAGLRWAKEIRREYWGQPIVQGEAQSLDGVTPGSQ